MRRTNADHAAEADAQVSQTVLGLQIRPKGARRSAKVLVLLALLLPVLCGMIGLVLDGGAMLFTYRNLQQVSDAAATTAAMALYNGATSADAIAQATTCVNTWNGLPNASVVVNIPPSTGPNVGNSNYAEVLLSQTQTTNFMQVMGVNPQQTVSVRSVAGYQASTAGAALVVLDPNPLGAIVDLSPYVSLSESLPAIQLGGLEVLGLGQLNINGAVLDNNTWGGVDQNGNQAGSSSGPPYGASCMPLVSLTGLSALNIRVVGGVDNQKNYSNYVSGQASPLVCNALPVADPYASLPVPTVSVDSVNVVATNFGGVNVTNVPLVSAPTVLTPGVYDWIQVTSGSVVFSPGVYIVRSVNPATQIALNVLAGQVTANGVMFYITNTTNYSATSGMPDAGDAGSTAPAPSLTTLVPSVVIASLLGSKYSPITSGPFGGLTIYQRRLDRRPIALADQSLLLAGTLSGSIYGKYSQVIFACNGTFDLKFVSGSMRFANLLQTTIAPSQLLPPAQDVYLVE
jgi:Flp pilus assembly protein TadG